MGYIGPSPNPGQNREVDDISSGFNGGTASFTLQVNGQNVSPGSANAIIVSLGGVIQNPGTDYTVAASTITFTTNPASGLSFFGLVLGQQVDTEGAADNSITTAKIVDDAVTTAKILDDNVTFAKIQNVSATDRILGRDSSGAGVIEEITPAALRTMINVENGATAGGGKVLQVVQTIKTDTTSFSIGSGGTHTDNTFTATITPSATSSKILVHIMLNHGTSSNQIVGLTALRNSSQIDDVRGAASGSRARCTAVNHSGETSGLIVSTLVFLDSPSSTSAQTYHLNFRHNSSSTRTHYINRSNDDNDASGNGMGGRCASTIVLMEIAG